MIISTLEPPRKGYATVYRTQNEYTIVCLMQVKPAFVTSERNRPVINCGVTAVYLLAEAAIAMGPAG